MIKVNFFAALREQLQCSELQLSAENLTSVEQVRNAIIAQQPDWKVFLDNNSLLSAVNHNMVDDNHPVISGDEVAFFPPVTGG